MNHDGEPDSYEYAFRLATWIWEKHYKNESPHWKPLNDLLGVLTQIDNMVTGLVRAQPEQQHSEQWWRHEVSNAYANGYEKGRASVKQPEQEPVACPYCHYSHTLGAVYFDQNCAGCVKRMTAPPQREDK